MKSINKYLWMSALAALLAFTSCDDGNIGAQYTPSAEEQGYSFLTETTTEVYKTTYTEKVSNIVLGRNFPQGQATIELSYEGLEEPLTAPESVTFEDGQTFVNIPIGIEGMEAGEFYEFSISFDPSLASSIASDKEDYVKEGISTVDVLFSVDYTWVSAGEVVMYTDWSGTETIVPIEEAKEYQDEDGNHLYRLVNWMFCLEPEYAEEGYHFQFYLDKDYNALFPAASWQLMGESDESAEFGYYYDYDGEYDCAFENDGNTYFLNALIAYDEAGELGLYDYEYAEWTWEKGFPGELPEPVEPEPEEELIDLGEGFGIINFGGNAEAYTGNYMAEFISNGRSAYSEVSISMNEDGGLVLSGLSSEGYEIRLNRFGGLLYFQSQQVGSFTEVIDSTTMEEVTYSIYAFPYSSEEDDFFEDAMLVGGFCSDGALTFINYPYNEASVDGIIFIGTDGDEEFFLADEFIPTQIFLYPAEEDDEEEEGDEEGEENEDEEGENEDEGGDSSWSVIGDDGEDGGTEEGSFIAKSPKSNAFSMKAAERVMKNPIVKGTRVRPVK